MPRNNVDHQVHELIADRWSPYVFADKPVSRDDLRSLFEAARWAPSSYNEQPWRYILAVREDDPKLFEEVLACLVEGNQGWAKQVPVLALGIVSRKFARNDKPNKAAEHDLGIAAAQLTMEATARGLRVHQMIGIQPDEARKRFNIPDDFDAHTGIAIGYHGDPDSAPEDLAKRDQRDRTRRPLSETVFGRTFGEASDIVK